MSESQQHLPGSTDREANSIIQPITGQALFVAQVFSTINRSHSSIFFVKWVELVLTEVTGRLSGMLFEKPAEVVLV